MLLPNVDGLGGCRTVDDGMGAIVPEGSWMGGGVGRVDSLS